jgi:hypothetical protein
MNNEEQVGAGGSVEVPDDDYDDRYDEGCYECGGDGFVSDCFEEWACLDPEYGCDLCTRRCPLCNPAKRNAELDQALSDALSSAGEAQPTEQSHDD